MARIIILGAGISGHTAARHLGRWVGKEHEVVVVSPRPTWNWVPSNIWVGVGEMTAEQVTRDLRPIYQRLNIAFHQANALSIHPEGDGSHAKPFVRFRYTDPARPEQIGELEYDYLINATGPKLNFAATPGLGPEAGNSVSVCTPAHATEANARLQEQIAAMRAGADRTFVIGTGHGMATCQGAAFEYIYNVDHTLRKAGVRERARLIWLSNEYELGDFGIGGVVITRGGYVTSGKVFAESLMAERGMEWITRAHVTRLADGKIHYELLDGSHHELPYDFAMLIPPFAGVGLKAIDRGGNDIGDQIFAPNGFMKVDADYSAKPYEAWGPADWPRTYQSPRYPNLFAVGIAFAPPHLISKPMKSPNGTPINPSAARTGMPSAAIAKAVAASIRDLLQGAPAPTHTASMAEMGAVCVASTGCNISRGTAATMVVYPVVPDYGTYPDYGRDLRLTFGEVGLAGHWIKYLLHHAFTYQAEVRPGWALLPH